MSFLAVMFDLDGTLADTLEDIAGAANHALAQLGRQTFPVPRYRFLAGQGLEWLMTEALGPEHRGLVPRGMEIFRAYYALHSEDHTRPYDGIPELLDELTRRKVKLAVLSNKPDPATQALVARVFARWRFDAILGHREPFPLKPDPTSAKWVADEMKIAPENWIYVGDTRVDMLTARGAGMHAVGVLWGFREEPELRESGANAIVRVPGELLGLLG
jgi:phosphoglycolate phosphatase